MRAITAVRNVCAVTVGSLALIASTGVAAHADATTVKDRASDVVAYELDLADENAAFDEDGTVLNYAHSIASGVDLRTMRVRHGNDTVSVKLKFAELRRDAAVVIAFRLDGQAEPDHLLMSTSRKAGEITDAKGKRQCKVPLTTRTGRKGTVTAVIDRSCLDNPKRIKVAAVSVTLKLEGDLLSARQDVLSRDNLRIPSWTRWLKAG